MTASHGVDLDEELASDVHAIMDEAEDRVLKENGEGSFLHMFWRQQKEATSRSGRGRRWHPMMVRWCIYLRHQSSKAYETMRESGCIQLPSQRTLRDYTNAVKARAGFSAEVDRLLMRAANVAACEPWQRPVILLLDEMYVKEDLVYDKHTGCVTGFVNMGDHLLEFERSVKGTYLHKKPTRFPKAVKMTL